MRAIEEIIKDLTKPIAARHVKTRKQGGNTLSYIEWHVACSYLDLYAPGWSWGIDKITELGKTVVIQGTLSIPCLEGVCSRSATGIEEEDAKSYGDPISNAHAMAFKRACAMFGLARHLYNKDAPQGITPAQARQEKAKGSPPQNGQSRDIDLQIGGAMNKLVELGVSAGELQSIMEETANKGDLKLCNENDKALILRAYTDAILDLEDQIEGRAGGPY
jgi:hypothetical protein